MKIVLLAPVPPPFGGIATWAQRLVTANVSQNKFEYKIVNEQPSEKRGLFGNSKRNYFDEWKRCCRIWKDLKSALKDESVALVHANIPSTTFAMLREYVCCRITKAAKRKFVMHFHCTIPNMQGGKVWEIIFKKICDASDGIIVLNRQAESFVKKYTDTYTQIIPNFVSEAELRKESKVINENISKVLFVGGGVEGKGCKEFIETACAFKGVEFRICGNCSDDIIEYKRIKKADNVILCGIKDREEVTAELNEADVFLFLSHFRGEGFSVALTEAMAAGLPCLVTDWAANKEMIGDGGGFVVHIRDSKSAIEALKKMEPKEVREAQSKYNIEKVKNEYIDSVVIDKYVDLYESLL